MESSDHSTRPSCSHSLDRVLTLLQIPVDRADPLLQDWELIYADPDRIDEFCDVYERVTLEDEVKCHLMGLIVASLDRYLEEGRSPTRIWRRIHDLLKRDIDLHKDLINYWSLIAEADPNNGFAVTPYMRSFKMEMCVPDPPSWIWGYLACSDDDRLQDDALRELQESGCDSITRDDPDHPSRNGLHEILLSAGPGDIIAVWSLRHLSDSWQGLVEVVNRLGERNLHLRCVKEGFDTSNPSGSCLFNLFRCCLLYTSRCV